MVIDRTSDATFDVVNVKGLGDLVIALTCMKRVPAVQRSRWRFLLGQHLLPLWRELAPPFEVVPFGHVDRGAAALFQVKARSLRDIARSAWSVRRAIRQTHQRERTLLFDEYDVRHRFLSLGMSAASLPARDNLYRAWNDFLARHGTVPDGIAPPVAAGPRLHIFPGAREAERRFAPALLHDLVVRARSAGLEPRILTVVGEMPELAGLDLPLEEMPRDFAATVAAVSSADRVVSADSMTAHLSEYLARPVFVLAPIEKYFWLPLSAAESGRYALFTDALERTTMPTFLQ